MMCTRVASFPRRFGLGPFSRRFTEVAMQRMFPPLRHRALAVTVFIVSSAVIATHQSINCGADAFRTRPDSHPGSGRETH